MATLTNTQGALIAGCTPNDTVTITVTSGAYSLEYPIGTVLASASTSSTTYPLGAGQFRLTTTGSITYTLNANVDTGSVPVSYDPASGGLYAGSSLVSGAGNTVAGLTGNSSASAAANTTAIQAALSAVGVTSVLGGTVLIPPGLGDVYIAQTGSTGTALTIYSNTELVVGTGTRMRLTGGTSNMLVNANRNATLKAVTNVTSADGKTATIVFPSAHGFAVGSYFFLIGCVPDTYNGVWPVKSVSTTSVANDTLTFTLSSHLGTESPLITSPATINAGYSTTTYLGTTTILASAADANITIRGGSWYFDIVANTGGTDYKTFGWFLGRIANLTVRDVFWESCRNPIVPHNIYGGRYDNINCRNIGSLIQHSGSCRGVSIGTVRGDAWDDHTTFLIGDYPGYADVRSSVLYGDMDEIVVDNQLGENAYRFVKLVGQTNFKFGTVSIGRMHGRTPLGAAAAFTVQDDTGITAMTGTAGASGTYIETLNIDELSSRDACGAHGIDIQNATINTFNLGKINLPLYGASGVVGIAFTNSATVNVCNIGVANFSCSAYNGNPYGILQDATIGEINIGTLYVKNIGYGYIQGTNATNNTIINVANFITVNCGQGVVTKKGGTWVNINYAERNGYQSSPWMQLDGNTDFNVLAGRGLFAADAFGGSAATKTPHNFSGIGVDVGGTGVARQAGAIGFHKTGTGRGTLVDGNLVVCDATGAANSWKQVSNTTLTF